MIENIFNAFNKLNGHPFIFIFGAPRSETTLLSAMLNSHSNVAIPYESNFIVHCYNKYGLTPVLTNAHDLEHLIDEILTGYFVSKWEPKVNKEDLNFESCRDLPSLINELYSCYVKKRGKPIWGDKKPGCTPELVDHYTTDYFRMQSTFT